MYESFFHLRQRPFLVAPSPDRYFPAHAIEHARQTLVRCIERAQGPALLIGPAGTGKSLLCQILADQFRNHFKIVQLANTKLCTRRALLQSILFELNLPYRDMDEGELRLSLVDHLEPTAGSPHGMLLIVDEAHTLPWRLMEEIRMITNLMRQGEPRVRLVLSGGPQLEERFASPKLESFNQRIAARCYLQSLNKEETFAYIRSQISIAGGDPGQLFSAAALRSIFVATDGIPRLVNQVCDYALLLASVAGSKTVESAAVEEAWGDLQQLPGPWQTSTDKLPLVTPSSIVEFGTLDDQDTPVSAPESDSFIAAAHEGHTHAPTFNSSQVNSGTVKQPDPDEQMNQIETSMAEVYAAESLPPQTKTTSPKKQSKGEASTMWQGITGEAHGKSIVKSHDPIVPSNPFGDFSEEEVVIEGSGELLALPYKTGHAFRVAKGKNSAKLLNCSPPQPLETPANNVEPLAPATLSFDIKTRIEETLGAISNQNLNPETPAKSFGTVPKFVADANSKPNLPTISFQLPLVAETEIPEARFDPADDPVFPERDVESLETIDVEYPSGSLQTEIGIESLPFVQSFVATTGSSEFAWPTNDALTNDSQTISVKKLVPHDDRDLLIVDDEAALPPPDRDNGVPGNARRLEYRQLFAKLRRS